MSSDALPLLPLILDNVPRGLRQALAQEGVPCRGHRPGSAEGRFVLFDGRVRTGLALAPGQTPLDVSQLRAEWPCDPFEALVDTEAAPFQWQIGPFTVRERIARFDKRTIRRCLLQRLRTVLEEAGGVWLRVAPFPFPYRSAFNFRLDYDNHDAADFDATLAALAGHEDATSHFVNASAYATAPEALARLRGLDVGSHGYWHHTYRTVEENRRNIARGIEVLQRAGLEPVGFTAPHGRFNAGLLQALVEQGIPYSSEFALVYDELPTLVGTSNLLQIPIHPVCLGLFLDVVESGGEANAVQAVMEHFEQLFHSRYRMGEPAFLYGHPDGRLGRYPQVLRHVLALAEGRAALWKTTFREMNAWWRARAGVRVTVTRSGDELLLMAERLASSYRLAVEYWRGQHVAVVPLDEAVLRLAPSALAYERRSAEATVRPVRVDAAEGLRGRVRRLIDWERVTPVEEIPANSWRNVAKRALRQWMEV